jgi:hypothetical protein
MKKRAVNDRPYFSETSRYFDISDFSSEGKLANARHLTDEV